MVHTVTKTHYSLASLPTRCFRFFKCCCWLLWSLQHFSKPVSNFFFLQMSGGSLLCCSIVSWYRWGGGTLQFRACSLTRFPRTPWIRYLHIEHESAGERIANERGKMQSILLIWEHQIELLSFFSLVFCTATLAFFECNLINFWNFRDVLLMLGPSFCFWCCIEALAFVECNPIKLWNPRDGLVFHRPKQL